MLDNSVLKHSLSSERFQVRSCHFVEMIIGILCEKIFSYNKNKVYKNI